MKSKGEKQMKKTTRKNNWSKKRMEQQREMIWIRQLEDADFCYQPTVEAYSNAKCQMHRLGLQNELPGRDALKSVLLFLETYKPKEKYQYYALALKVAQKKVEGRRFVDADGQNAVVQNLDDVVQIIRESLRAAGIYEIPVKEFIYSLVG